MHARHTIVIGASARQLAIGKTHTHSPVFKGLGVAAAAGIVNNLVGVREPGRILHNWFDDAGRWVTQELKDFGGRR